MKFFQNNISEAKDRMLFIKIKKNVLIIFNECKIQQHNSLKKATFTLQFKKIILTSTSSLGGGGGVGNNEFFFLGATDEGSIGVDTVVSGGKGGRTATPSPRGRVPDKPTACGSGVSPGASGLSSVRDMSNDNWRG